MRTRIRKALMNGRGDTLVTVLVAFVMIMLVCGIFYRAVLLSNNMIDRAEKLRMSTEAALVRYYAERAEEGGYTGTGMLTFVRGGASGESFTLPGEVASPEGASPEGGYSIEYFK